jgi:hypothetical protein
VIRIPISVIPHDKYLELIEKEGVLVCVPLAGKKMLDDNVVSRCEVCDCEIQFRPYNKKARHKVCVSCANKFLAEKKR